MKKQLMIGLMTVILCAEECSYKYLGKNNVKETMIINVNDKYGCEYENRDIQKYNKEIILSFDKDKNKNKILRYHKSGKNIIFDIFPYSAPETEKIRSVVYLKKRNLLAISHGYNVFSRGRYDLIEVDSAFYKTSIYKVYNNFFLKIFLKNNKLKGVEGFYNYKYSKYKYKYFNNFSKIIGKIKIKNKKILNSLETFLKLNYTNTYNSKKNFKENSFDLKALNAILYDIKIEKKTLTTYNNIAYYLQKANANKEAIYLLEKILEKFPNRTVAHYNLADAYWAMDDKKKAKEHYNIYIKQMKAKGKEKRIPKVVKQRVLSK